MRADECESRVICDERAKAEGWNGIMGKGALVFTSESRLSEQRLRPLDREPASYCGPRRRIEMTALH